MAIHVHIHRKPGKAKDAGSTEEIRRKIKTVENQISTLSSQAPLKDKVKLKERLKELEAELAKLEGKSKDALEKYETFPEHEKAMSLWRKLKQENKDPKFEETKSLGGSKLYKVSWKDSAKAKDCTCQGGRAAKDATHFKKGDKVRHFSGRTIYTVAEVQGDKIRVDGSSDWMNAREFEMGPQEHKERKIY